MKKTLTILAALGTFAVSSEAATVFNYYTPGADNYNSTIHGFYLGLDSSALAPVSGSGSPASLSGYPAGQFYSARAQRQYGH